MKKSTSRRLLGSSAAIVAICLSTSVHAQTDQVVTTATQSSTAAPAGSTSSQDTPAPDDNTIDDIVVTAQKREQSINSVGMSITAQSGDDLIEKGVRSVADLAKVVPGFTFEGAAGLAPIYSIRGIGFHDLSLASGQAVAVYADETPIPFGYETTGVDFDIERVEVLKGPQGTVFGQNSTGGAINYVMAKPTTTFEAGADLTYGRFGTSDISGFVSGPLSDTLLARVAFRTIQGGGWQRRYGPVPFTITPADRTNGRIDQFAGRALLDWRPTDQLKVLFNFNTRQEKSDTQAPQYIGLRQSSSQPILPGIVAFPIAPEDNRAASWDPGVDYAQDNRFKEAVIRAEYDIGPALITSISALQRYRRAAPARDYDATPYYSLRFGFFGNVKSFYQELRASGSFDGRGSWLFGGNFEHDETSEVYTSENPGASSRILFGLPNTGSRPLATADIKTYGIFGNAEYPVLENLTAQLGARYTKTDRGATGCSQDAGDGALAAIFGAIQRAFVAAGVKRNPVVPIAPGACVTLDADFNPNLFRGRLEEDNVSWRAGLNYTVTPGTLIYANVSRGYKAGSFPLAAATSSLQFTPVPQEQLTAYEAGFKSRPMPGLQLNAAAFYYDYKDKQINGSFFDATFGRLTRLVTIPTSRVYGFEATADWRPVPGLTLAPSVSYVKSEIRGPFTNLDPLGQNRSFVGEPFPYAPKWQANVNVEYKRDVGSNLNGFVGGNVSHQGKTNAAFGQVPVYRIDDYTLVDLRAGVESASGKYRFYVWGTNVFDTYYWQTANRNFDSDIRNTGQPARYGVTFSYRY